MSSDPHPTCPQGKVGFSGQRAALRHAAKMRRNDARRTAPGFAYLCSQCGTWHLTSQSPQGRRRRAMRAARAVGHRKPTSEAG